MFRVQYSVSRSFTHFEGDVFFWGALFTRYSRASRASVVKCSDVKF